MMIRLAIVTSHPIQYNAPLFKLLASDTRYRVKVFYTLGNSSLINDDKGFGRKIVWDIPVLEGYDYSFLSNNASKPSTRNFFGISNPNAIEEINRFNPNIIIIYGWSFYSHLKILRYFKGKVPIVFRGDSTLLDETKSFKTKLRRVVLHWVFKHIDYALYTGLNNKAYFKAHGIKEANLVFGPHAIDNLRFRKLIDLEDRLIRNEFNINPEAIVFLFAGKLEEKKNPLLLIEAIKAIDDPNIHLMIVGSGNLEEKIKNNIKCNKNIHLLPFQNQSRMPAVYRFADVLVLPSAGPGETWGLCVNEAMACGLPIIVSDKVGCAVDLVRNGVNGYIFESNNVEDLSDKILICASNKKKLKELGENSKRIIKEWDYSVVHSALVNLFENIIR